MMTGRGPRTRSCNSFYLLVQWHLALIYGCLSCLDLLFGYTLLYLVLTWIATACQSLSYLVCLPSLHLYFFVVYLVTCSFTCLMLAPRSCLVYTSTCLYLFFQWAWLCSHSCWPGGFRVAGYSRWTHWLDSKSRSQPRALHCQRVRLYLSS